jgi:hypothetical protein
LYAFLVLAIVAAYWFSDSKISRRTRIGAAIVVVLFLMPNPSAGFWISKVDTPALFSDGKWREVIRPNEIVLSLPFGGQGKSMLWQATADMSFRLAGGWTAITPPQYAQFPIVAYFDGAFDLPEAPDQLKAFIASKQVSTIAVATADHDYKIWTDLLAHLQLTPVTEEGLSMYRIPAGMFAAYSRLNPARLDARAVALRTDVLIESCARYLALGGSVTKLDPIALERAGLLPTNWIVSADKWVFRDFLVFPEKDRVGIAIGGTYEALRPLVERYRGIATEIYYPYPMKWSPERKYPSDDRHKRMVFIFDPLALARAAADLHESPPPEMTTPFLAGIGARPAVSNGPSMTLLR